MEITLPADLKKEVEKEVAVGHFSGVNQLVEQAVRYYLDDLQRGERRLAALRDIGGAVDAAGLYDRVFIPNAE